MSEVYIRSQNKEKLLMLYLYYPDAKYRIDVHAAGDADREKDN